MYMPKLTYHNYRQWMLQQQQRKDEVLAFEMKEPCTPLGQKVSGSDCEIQAQSWESNGKKITTTFLFVQTPLIISYTVRAK